MYKLKEDEYVIEMSRTLPVFGDRAEKPDNSIVLGGDFGDLVHHEGEYHIRRMFKKISPTKLVVYYNDIVNNNIEVRDDGGYEIEFREI